VALGWESSESYLSRNEPSYPIASWAAAVDPGMRLLSTEQCTFYFPGRTTREHIYRRRTAYDRELASPGDLSRRLRADGFTHLLLAESTSGSGIHYNQTLGRLVDAAIRDDGGATLTCLAEHDGADADGVVRHYRLIGLR
jgi:hypothetical protein